MSNINDLYRNMLMDKKDICNYMPLLRDYSKRHNLICEIGHGEGYSTVAISRALPEKFISYGSNLKHIESLIDKFNIKINIDLIPIVNNYIALLSPYDLSFINFYNCGFITSEDLKKISQLTRKTFMIYGIYNLEENKKLKSYIDHLRYNSIWEIKKSCPTLSDILILTRKRVGCCSR